ncbi:MAG TPA: hypothetical protein VK181_01475 [Rhizobium sp.]|nr:hypothetical protein [Rhizobium sp.]
MLLIASAPSVSSYASTAPKSGNPDASAVSFINSGAFSARTMIESLLVKLFGENEKLQTSFATQFVAEMQKAKNMGLSITDENAMHNALYTVITENRDMFPPGAFTIKTEFPGGGFIETPIPAINRQKAAEPSLANPASSLSALLPSAGDSKQVPASVAILAYTSAGR